ncbi:zinc finger protein 3 homolog [Thalassophryne amazonica]|uniref:zinc finger protein 3 homolog n=1 Tax=Thalassophryne amazonica TaxID=390379 RepID=UPI001470D792|nr:zinc finger protein 3 homolog [Thalassophryne amazonica]
MAEGIQPKLPLPPLRLTAHPDRKPRKRKPEAEKAAMKKARDKARGQTRVDIGAAFSRWRQLRHLKGLKSDAEVALFLLDRDVALPELGVQPRIGGGALDSSVHSMSCVKEEPQDSPDEGKASDLRNTTTDGAKTHQLLNMSVTETPNPPDHESAVFAEQQRVVSDMEMCPSNRSVWNWKSQPTLTNNLPAGDVTLASNNCFSGDGNGPRLLHETKETHLAANHTQTSLCEQTPPPSETDLSNHSCKIVVEVDDCDELPPATQDQDHNTAIAEDDETKCTEEDTEGLSSSEDELSDDSDDEDYIPSLSVWRGGSNVPKIRRDSRKPVSMEKTACDNAHIESKEQSPVLPSSQDLFGVTSVLGCDDDSVDDDAVGNKNSSSNEEPLKEKSEERNYSRKRSKTYKCPTCGRLCPCSYTLKRHLVIHSGERPFRCYICGRGFTQNGNLKTHMKVHKGESAWSLIQEKKPPVESPEIVNVCKECGMVFPEKLQLEEHYQSHQLMKCKVCGKTFKSEKSLKVHEHIHSQDSFIHCRVCGKRFPTEFCLKQHMLIHSAKKKFKCDQCDRAFRTSTALKYHLKTHTGERPHLCSICGKCFTKRFALKLHLQNHTGEKRYVCEHCGKGFMYSQSLQCHLQSHNKKPRERTKPLGRPKRQEETASNQ